MWGESNGQSCDRVRTDNGCDKDAVALLSLPEVLGRNAREVRRTMVLVTQGLNRVYFTESEDTLEVQENMIVLVRGNKQLKMGTYRSPERALEVFRAVVTNVDAGGLVFPEV